MKKNYFKSLAQVAMLLCVPLFIASCDELGTEDNPTPSYISMKTDAVTIMKGDTYTRTALAASSAVIEYKSEDEAIATVNATTGEVTGKADGTTNIVAVATGYSTGGKKIYLTEEVKYELTVQDPESSFAYDFGEAGVPKQIYAGTNIKFEPVAPQKSSGVLTYTYQIEKSTDEGTTWLGPVAPDAEGKFTADEAGWYKITATSATYKPYVTSHANITDSYIVKFDAAVAYSRWDATEKALKNDTILKSDLKGIISGPKSGGTLPGGTYYISGNSTLNSTIKLTGDVNIIIAKGKTLNIVGSITIDETPYKLNVFRECDATDATVTIAGSSSADIFKDLTEVNFHGDKFNVTLNTSGVGCGGFTGIEAVNIYGPEVVCGNTGTSGYGAKMKTGGTITLYKGSFKASGKGTDETYSKAVIGKLDMKAVGKKFIETDDNTAPDADWTAVPATGPTKLYVKTVAAE